jgi:hypothetical protein
MRTRHLVIADSLYFAFGKKGAQASERVFSKVTVSFLLVAFLSLFGFGAAYAQIPRSFSYQGFLVKSNQPVNGQVDLHLKIYNAGGEILYEETDNQVLVKKGDCRRA